MKDMLQKIKGLSPRPEITPLLLAVAVLLLLFVPIETKEANLSPHGEKIPVSMDSEKYSPKIKAAVHPSKVQPEDEMLVTAIVTDAHGVTSVVADMGGIEQLHLTLVNGTAHEGTWQGKWKVHGTEAREYTMTVIATSVVGMSSSAFVPLNISFASINENNLRVTASWSSPAYLLPGTHPSIIRDSNGIYRAAYAMSGDIYMTSSSNGKTWSEPIKLTSDAAPDVRPKLMQDAKGIYWVVFVSVRTGNADIFLMKSQSGVEWSTPLQLTTHPGFDAYPNTLMQDSKGIYWVGFVSDRDGAYTVFLMNSMDGMKWSKPWKVTHTPTMDSFPVMIQDSRGVYWLAFSRLIQKPSKFDIFLMNSTDAFNWSEAVRLTAFSANNNYPDFLQDSFGRYWIAFTSTRTGNEDIFIMGSQDGAEWSNPQQLTHNMINRTRDFKCDYKSLTEDSRGMLLIAYHCVREPEGIWYVTGKNISFEYGVPRGTVLRSTSCFGELTMNQVTTSAYSQALPAWSPDGSKIAFSSDEIDEGDIWLMNADGRGKRLLIASGGKQETPSWSPDGKKIAYVSSESGNQDISTIDVSTMEKKQLTFQSSRQFYPSWSPDGSKIAYVSDQSGNLDIWVMNADGSGKKQLTVKPSHESYSRWSPDGKKIAFESNQGGNWDIWIMNADGTNVAQLTSEPANQGGASWSPDGKKIAFESNQGGNWDIWIMNADGSNQTRLTTSYADEYFPSWNPDGRKIAYQSLQSGNHDIWILDISNMKETLSC